MANWKIHYHGKNKECMYSCNANNPIAVYSLINQIGTYDNLVFVNVELVE